MWQESRVVLVAVCPTVFNLLLFVVRYLSSLKQFGANVGFVLLLTDVVLICLLKIR